MIMSVQC